jgi:hypothetical protein
MSNGWVILAAVALLAAYVLTCAVYPLTAHGRCKGTGKLRSPTGKAWRRCPGCRGSRLEDPHRPPPIQCDHQ